MTRRRDWLFLLLGLVVGAGATSLYWHSSQKHRQFVFDHNLKCQEIAKQFESEGNYRTGILKVSYSSIRNSCVAEVIKPDSGGVYYSVQDLLSGETMFMKRGKAGEILDDQILKEQEAKFVAASK